MLLILSGPKGWVEPQNSFPWQRNLMKSIKKSIDETNQLNPGVVVS